MAADRDYVIERVHRLSEAPMTYEGLKEKADAFLGAVDTAEEKSAFRELIEEIKSDVLTIDQLISFTESPEGVAVFGEKKASGLTGQEDTCICPACQACKEILANQAAIAS